MEIKGEYSIPSDRETVWAALNDRAVLERCIPGCESLEQAGEHEFHAKVAAAIGPVRAKFDTRIRLEALNPPESYTLSGESKARAAGFGRGSADVTLTEQDGGTLLTYSAEFKVGGKLAQVGSRLVAGVTRKTADDFFSCFARELGGGAAVPEKAVARQPAPAGIPRKWLAIGAAVIALLAAWILLG